MKRTIKRILISLAVLAAVLALLIAWAMAPLGGRQRKIEAAVPVGASTRKAAFILWRAGAIRVPAAFILAARIRGVSGKLVAGRYEFSSDMGLLAVLDKIIRGDIDAVWVTIPEGYNARQIARVLDRKKLCSYEAFLIEAYHYQGGPALEGFLFPDTYLIPFKSSPHEIVGLMNRNFNRRVWRKLQGDFSASGRNVYEILTVASMIENEAKVPGDRPLIASVIYNRLGKGMRLQIDATVDYALGEHRSRIFNRDLLVNSPYNTYRHAGLPPGPICNPGIKSIEAALHPATSDYLYYVAAPDGSHVFTRTVEEHADAIRRVRGGG